MYKKIAEEFRKMADFCEQMGDAKNEEQEEEIAARMLVTSYEGGKVVAESYPELRKRIINAAKENGKKKVQLAYDYPAHVVTAAAIGRYALHGIEFRVRNQECVPIEALDAQKATGKKVYGGGLLLSEKAAAEKATAEKMAKRAGAERAVKRKDIAWKLSARERDIISTLKPEKETGT